MSKLRLALAGLLVVMAGAQARLTTTIEVTTTADEDGTNPRACSLREAIQAVNLHAPYGGCTAGSAFDDNLIQLQPGNYTLTSELTIESELTIAGKDSLKETHDKQLNPLTGKAPRPIRPDFVDATAGATGTSITAAPGARIFNAKAALTVKDLVLKGSGSPVSGNGGIVYTSNALALDNVIMRDGSVSGASVDKGNGGAIFLAGDGSTLSLTDVTLYRNAATNKGGAVAMLCSVGVSPFAVHTVNASRTLFRENTATLGAGAIEACGNSLVQLTASTFAKNTSAASSGTLAYVQPPGTGLGQVALSYVTAAEQNAHVLVLGGLANVSLTGSLLARFTDTTASLCHNPGAPSPMMANTSPTGAYNALDDNSCDALLTGNSNVYLPAGTPRTAVLHPLTQTSYPSAGPAAPPFGLTDYYLPVAGSPVVDAGGAFTGCTGVDQRGLERHSGTACDMGAVELLQATANDDEANSTPKTNRLAVIDVLANDTFGEGSSGPYQFLPNTPSSPTVEIQPADSAGGRCAWQTEGQEHAGKLVVDNGGVLTPEDAPIVCQYAVRDSSGTLSAKGKVTVTIKNAPPEAVSDFYVRPVGQPSLSFNPMENDNDDGDGKYGRVDPNDPSSAPDWARFYPVEIVSEPELGKVVGTSQGLCPGSSEKRCLTPPLRYLADNNLSPFTDSFTYRVYDNDGSGSNAATVTIATDAPDPDHGGGAGSLDLLGGVLLSLLGLRRLRRL